MRESCRCRVIPTIVILSAHNLIPSESDGDTNAPTICCRLDLCRCPRLDPGGKHRYIARERRFSTNFRDPHEISSARKNSLPYFPPSRCVYSTLMLLHYCSTRNVHFRLHGDTTKNTRAASKSLHLRLATSHQEQICQRLNTFSMILSAQFWSGSIPNPKSSKCTFTSAVCNPSHGPAG